MMWPSYLSVLLCLYYAAHSAPVAFITSLATCSFRLPASYYISPPYSQFFVNLLLKYCCSVCLCPFFFFFIRMADKLTFFFVSKAFLVRSSDDRSKYIIELCMNLRLIAHRYECLQCARRMTLSVWDVWGLGPGLRRVSCVCSSY